MPAFVVLALMCLTPLQVLKDRLRAQRGKVGSSGTDVEPMHVDT